MEAGLGEKCEKVTLKAEKEALEQAEQNRTKPNKNRVKSGHRNERGRKEMDLSSKQALAGKKQRSEWIRALKTTQKTTTLKIKELGGSWTKKRASKSCTQKREKSYATP